MKSTNIVIQQKILEIIKAKKICLGELKYAQKQDNNCWIICKTNKPWNILQEIFEKLKSDNPSVPSAQLADEISLAVNVPMKF